MLSVATQTMTAEAFFEMGNLHAELIDGEIVEMSPAGPLHGGIILKLGYFFHAYLIENPIGSVTGAEAGFILSRNPDVVRAPDVAFIPRERLPAEGLPAQFTDIVPSLVIEVVSPSDRAGDVENKRAQWLAFGVSQVWVVYPESKSVHVFGGETAIYGAGDTLRPDAVLPGFALPVNNIFA